MHFEDMIKPGDVVICVDNKIVNDTYRSKNPYVVEKISVVLNINLTECNLYQIYVLCEGKCEEILLHDHDFLKIFDKIKLNDGI